MCAELMRLREEARALALELKKKRQLARERSGKERAARPHGKNDFEWYFQRRLARTTARIESHLNTHRCAE